MVQYTKDRFSLAWASQKGMSIVELALAAGLMGIFVLATSQVVVSQKKAEIQTERVNSLDRAHMVAVQKARNIQFLTKIIAAAANIPLPNPDSPALNPDLLFTKCLGSVSVAQATAIGNTSTSNSGSNSGSGSNNSGPGNNNGSGGNSGPGNNNGNGGSGGGSSTSAVSGTTSNKNACSNQGLAFTYNFDQPNGGTATSPGSQSGGLTSPSGSSPQGSANPHSFASDMGVEVVCSAIACDLIRLTVLTADTANKFEKRRTIVEIPGQSLVNRTPIAFDCSATGDITTGVNFGALRDICRAPAAVTAIACPTSGLPLGQIDGINQAGCQAPENQTCPAGMVAVGIFAGSSQCATPPTVPPTIPPTLPTTSTVPPPLPLPVTCDAPNTNQGTSYADNPSCLYGGIAECSAYNQYTVLVKCSGSNVIGWRPCCSPPNPPATTTTSTTLPTVTTTLPPGACSATTSYMNGGVCDIGITVNYSDAASCNAASAAAASSGSPCPGWFNCTGCSSPPTTTVPPACLATGAFYIDDTYICPGLNMNAEFNRSGTDTRCCGGNSKGFCNGAGIPAEVRCGGGSTTTTVPSCSGSWYWDEGFALGMSGGVPNCDSRMIGPYGSKTACDAAYIPPSGSIGCNRTGFTNPCSCYTGLTTSTTLPPSSCQPNGTVSFFSGASDATPCDNPPGEMPNSWCCSGWDKARSTAMVTGADACTRLCAPAPAATTGVCRCRQAGSDPACASGINLFWVNGPWYTQAECVLHTGEEVGTNMGLFCAQPCVWTP